MPTRNTPMETALFNKLGHLPVMPRRKLHLRRFGFSKSTILCMYRSVNCWGRRYTMCCEVVEDGSLEVSFRSARVQGKARRMPKASHVSARFGY